MAEKVENVEVCNPLKLHYGLTGKYHAICHYSYNLPLAFIVTRRRRLQLKDKNYHYFAQKITE